MSIDVWVVALIKHLKENFVTFKRFFFNLVNWYQPCEWSFHRLRRHIACRILYSNLCKDIELCRRITAVFDL